MKPSPFEADILRALRRITRAIDLHSRHLATTFGLTGPQLICLLTIGQKGPITPSGLAKEVSLSQATITGIIDRLTARNLVTRERSTKDRRLVTIAITPAGQELIGQAPSPLQVRFTEQLAQLSEAQQLNLRNTLNLIVQMMGGADLPAEPLIGSSTLLEAERLADVEEAVDSLLLAPAPPRNALKE